MNVGVAQINTTVGDLRGNAALIIKAYEELVVQGADLVITPELALTGYPPQDLLFLENFVEDNLKQLTELEKKVGDVPLLVGFVDKNRTKSGKPFYNAAALLRSGEDPLIAHKRLLPNYDVFEETRYFEPGTQSICFSHAGRKWGITICEDLWSPDYLLREFYCSDPPEELVLQGAEVILNLSASPFTMGKPAQRLAMLQAQAKRLNVPIIYCNAIGGNDQLIFDGHSLGIRADGQSLVTLQGYVEEKKMIRLSFPHLSEKTSSQHLPLKTTQEDSMQELYNALVLGLHDYLYKCGFRKAILGLSGGIDSALVATLAVAALGAENVQGVLMPGPYSSQGSIDDALALVDHLAITHHFLPITSLYEKALENLKTVFSNSSSSYVHEQSRSFQQKNKEQKQSVTEENLQARLRALTLMALSNKLGALLLTTGNKSELAVGYCTLYGDMCGGLAVLADLPKTVVYRLAHWMNRKEEIIPWNSIHKAPSAELRPNQKDQDTLPPYEILDEVLRLLLEEHRSPAHIISLGFDQTIVQWIAYHVAKNEYKRQQAPPALKVTSKAFGLGRRFPIAQHYREE